MSVIGAHGIRPGTRFWRGPDRYDYHVNRTMAGGRISLRCTQYYLERCSGRASVERCGTGFRQTQSHNHDPDKYIAEARCLRYALMERCRSGDNTAFKTMYNQERRKLNIRRQAAARVPLVTLRSSMRRARMECRPNIPHTLKALDKILRQRRYRCLTQTLDGKDNIYSGRAGSARMRTMSLIFFTRRMRRHMKRVQRIFCDATFAPVPRAMKACQIWTISTIKQHHVFPLVRVLMRRRTKDAYLAALERIKTLVPHFKPKEIFTDYESGEQAALKLAFPDAQLHGCLFHYAKAIGDNARKLHMTRTIRKSPVVRSLVRSFCVLPLLPQPFIIKGFKAIVKHAIKKRKAGHIIDLAKYWSGYWQPKVHLLSVCGCEDRTTNGSECDNRMLQAAVHQKSPYVWDCIDGLLEMEDSTEQDIMVVRALRRPSRRRATSAVSNDEKIQALTKQLEEGDISVATFLKRASYTIVSALNRGLNGKKKGKQ